MIPERAWLDRVRAYAQLNQWLCYHTHDSRRSAPGFPDLVLVRGGRLLFAELKTDRGIVTLPQREWLAALTEANRVETHVWRPANWPHVQQILARRLVANAIANGSQTDRTVGIAETKRNVTIRGYSP